MRRWLLVMAVCGCRGGEARPVAAPDAAPATATAPDAAPTPALELPRSERGVGVTAAAAAARPAAIVVVGADGALALAPTPASWPDGALRRAASRSRSTRCRAAR